MCNSKTALVRQVLSCCAVLVYCTNSIKLNGLTSHLKINSYSSHVASAKHCASDNLVFFLTGLVNLH